MAGMANEAFTSHVALDAVSSSSLLASFYAAWHNDPRAVWSSFSMIVVSEIGDKTFLIAAILAMRQSRTTVFAGAFAALALMSILSAFMGVVLPTLLPRSVTTLMAAVLFLVFGVKMLRDATQMTGEEMGEEWEEAKREVEEEEGDEGGGADLELGNMEEANGQQRSGGGGGGGGNGFATHRSTPSLASPNKRKSTASTFSTERLKEGTRNLCGLCFSPVFAHSFILTFLGEWGDRSQIATIALAAAHNIWLVAFGTIAGHFLCTGMAVIGGRWIATRISVKHVTLGGAIMFILFGFIYAFESFSEARSGPATAATAALQESVGQAAALAANADVDGLPPGLDGLGNALRRRYT